MSSKAQDVNEISRDPRDPSRPSFYRNKSQLPTRVDVSSTEHGARKAHGSYKRLNLVKSIPEEVGHRHGRSSLAEGNPAKILVLWTTDPVTAGCLIRSYKTT